MDYWELFALFCVRLKLKHCILSGQRGTKKGVLKQEEARIPETYPHEEVNLTLPYLPFILASTYIIEPVALNSSPV